MSTLNKVILIGRLGRDPEARYTQGNQKIVNLSVATSERWTDRTTGERKERTEWHRVVIFNEGLAGIAEQYLRKGSLAYLEGELRTRTWTDQSGQERQTTEIVLPQFHGRLVLLGDRSEPAREPAQAPAAPMGGMRPATKANAPIQPADLTAPPGARRPPKPAVQPTTEEILDDEIPF